MAFFAIFIGYILITFLMPFFALIRQRRSFEVSVQISAALGVFFLASIFGSTLVRWVGPKKITFLSLALATGACFILSKESLEQKEAG